jgi:hypothetical protein
VFELGMVTESVDIEVGRVVVGKLDDNHWRQSCHEWTHTWVHKDPFRVLDRSSHDMVASGCHNCQQSNPPGDPYDTDRARHDTNCWWNHIGSGGDYRNGHARRANQELRRDDEREVAMESLGCGGAVICGFASSTKIWSRTKNAQWTWSVI